MGNIRFENYTVYFKQKKDYFIAVDDVTLDIPDGKTTVIIGPSGCGKSTLLKCILGSIDYAEGKLTVDGVAIENSRCNIGYVSQEYGLFPKMTVYENIAFPLRMQKMSFDEIDRRVKSVAKQIDIELLLTRLPKYLSGGQQQRVAIARAIVKKPDILLFDEPFANLQPNMRAELHAVLKQIANGANCTIVFVTHDLPEAFQLADNLVVMNDGCVEQSGSVAELLRNPVNGFVKSFLQKDVCLIE